MARPRKRSAGSSTLRQLRVSKHSAAASGASAERVVRSLIFAIFLVAVFPLTAWGDTEEELQRQFLLGAHYFHLQGGQKPVGQVNPYRSGDL